MYFPDTTVVDLPDGLYEILLNVFFLEECQTQSISAFGEFYVRLSEKKFCPV